MILHYQTNRVRYAFPRTTWEREIDYLGDGTYTNGTLSYKLDGTILTVTDSATQQTVTVKDVKPSEIIEGEDRMLDVGLGIQLESSATQTTAPIGATYVTVNSTDEWHQYQIPIYVTDKDGIHIEHLHVEQRNQTREVA